MSGERVNPTTRPGATADSENITKLIQELGDWRGEALALVRKLIQAADPKILEEIKWKKPSNPAGVPVWSDHGIVCTGEAHTAHVRITFARGASIKDPEGVFNSGFNGNTMRAVVLHEGDPISEAGFKALIRSAVAANSAASGEPSARKK